MNELERMMLRQRRRARAMERMTADMAWLIGVPAGSLRWLSTCRDLVEMVDLVWQARRLCDDRGLLLCREELARRAFAAVGLTPPGCLRHVAYEIRNRRRPELSMLHRYQELEGATSVIGRFVERDLGGEGRGERGEGREKCVTRR